jgi:hypothetical protein
MVPLERVKSRGALLVQGRFEPAALLPSRSFEDSLSDEANALGCRPSNRPRKRGTLHNRDVGEVGKTTTETRTIFIGPRQNSGERFDNHRGLRRSLRGDPNRD